MHSDFRRRAIFDRSIALLTMWLSISSLVASQTVRERLDQRTDYRPSATRPDEQLVEVARHFQIPMAIEWLNEDGTSDKLPKLKFEGGHVFDLIRAIVDRVPHEKLIVEDRIVRVFPPSALNHKFNFLNLRLKRYCVADESVLGANFAIRVGLDMMLYPEQFKHGFNGGYGGGEQLLWIKAINICVTKVTVRNLLTEIAAQSGKAAWIAHLTPEELNGKKPFWKGMPLNEYGTSPITGHWQFFELIEHDP